MGVNGFVLGVVKTVGYRPTGSSEREVNPLSGAPPRVQNPISAGLYKTIAMNPHIVR